MCTWPVATGHLLYLATGDSVLGYDNIRHESERKVRRLNSLRLMYHNLFYSDNDNDVVEGQKGLTHYALRDVIIFSIIITIMGIGGGSKEPVRTSTIIWSSLGILWRSTSSAGLGDFNI